MSEAVRSSAEPDEPERTALERIEQAEAAVRAAPTPRVLKRAAEMLARTRQLEARREVLAWQDEGQSPLTADELEAVDREWRG